jgi:hypothetical protein
VVDYGLLVGIKFLRNNVGWSDLRDLSLNIVVLTGGISTGGFLHSDEKIVAKTLRQQFCLAIFPLGYLLEILHTDNLQ